jgi:hypothetical protein
MVVSQLESTVVEESGQRTVLTNGVAECGAQQAALIFDALVFGVDEREEPVDMRTEVELAERFDLGMGLLLPGPIELEDAYDPREDFARDWILALIATSHALILTWLQHPTSWANRVVGLVVVDANTLLGWPIQEVIDTLGVGLHVAPVEHLADGGRGFARRVLEEDVIRVGDLDEEMATPAGSPVLVGLADRLDQDARRIGRDAERRAKRLLPHRLDDRRGNVPASCSSQRDIVPRFDAKTGLGEDRITCAMRTPTMRVSERSRQNVVDAAGTINLDRAGYR